MEEYTYPKRSVGIRLTAIFVIAAFLVTQVDLQLAFAFSVPHQVLNSTSSSHHLVEADLPKDLNISRTPDILYSQTLPVEESVEEQIISETPVVSVTRETEAPRSTWKPTEIIKEGENRLEIKVDHDRYDARGELVDRFRRYNGANELLVKGYISRDRLTERVKFANVKSL